MQFGKIGVMAASVAMAALGTSPGALAQQANMSFFITSVGPGKGADLGGLEGADRHCQSLAQAAGADGKTWRAYLSTQAAGGATAVNARDRIGRGPWQNAKGEVIAKSVDDLHGAESNVSKETLLTEKGEIVGGYGDRPNRHDILTGSTAEGRAFPAEPDRTCKNWTSSTDGTAMVGHSDRRGPGQEHFYKSWNSSHTSRGCSQQGLISTGGDGLLYCFAAN